MNNETAKSLIVEMEKLWACFDRYAETLDAPEYEMFEGQYNEIVSRLEGMLQPVVPDKN